MDVGHHGIGDVEVKLNDIADLDYVMTLLKQLSLKTA